MLLRWAAFPQASASLVSVTLSLVVYLSSIIMAHLSCADPSYAKEFLGWEATRGYEEMCEDLWRWQCDNPDGFVTPKGSPRSLA